MRIYLSYRMEDSFSIAEQFRTQFKECVGDIRLVMDAPRTMPEGLVLSNYVRNTIAPCELVFVLIGPNWAVNTATDEKYFQNENDPVLLEVLSAYDLSITVVPVFVKGGGMPDRKFIPEYLYLYKRLLRSRHERLSSDNLDAGIDYLLRQYTSSGLIHRKMNEEKLKARIDDSRLLADTTSQSIVRYSTLIKSILTILLFIAILMQIGSMLEG